MRKRWMTAAACLTAVSMMMAACGGSAAPAPQQTAAPAQETPAAETKAAAEASAGETTPAAETSSAETAPETVAETEAALPEITRQGFLPEEDSAPEVKAEIPEYTVDPDLGNVVNTGDFYLEDGMREMLAENGFAVSQYGSYEFWETYEDNRYQVLPNFVTVDSMMHTYHLYFAMLQKQTEKNFLAERLGTLSKAMLAKSEAQLEALKGSEWEEAAKRNVAFFSVGARLLDPSAEIPAETEELVKEELARIEAHDQIEESKLTGTNEDYTQYIVRGYYEGDEQLEPYFRAMMWFGRLNFRQSEEDLDRSALLMTIAMDDETRADWEAIYQVTSFFAGASDDSGYFEYKPLADEAYGPDVTAEKLAGDAAGWEKFHALTEQLPAPKINSVPMDDAGTDVDHVSENKGFRFMGQRFSADAMVFQNLIYNNVDVNGKGEKRMLPNALDIPAAFGSDEAMVILEEKGETDYAGYTENMRKLRDGLAAAPQTFWNASLASRWEYTLLPILEEKGSGYPRFMQNQQWARKNLMTFLGSYTELKHDTVLYAKQAIAEMGGADIPKRDDRGYAEPEPELYRRLAVLTGATSEGLENYGLLSDGNKESLGILKDLAERLQVISEKELRGETLTDEEYELIRSYGGSLEHFWRDVADYETAAAEHTVATKEYPAAVVTDVATDPNGQVLELGTGEALKIYVIAPVDGELKICSGAVYSFYQFPYPMDQRLTDSEWRQKISIQHGENYQWQESEFLMENWTDGFIYYNK